MRALALTLVTLGLLSASAFGALPVDRATAVATPHGAGARPASLKITLSLELRCGRLGPAAIVVALPRAWRVPKSIAVSAVRVDRGHPKDVSVTGHTVTLQPVAPTGTCTVIGPGKATVTFMRAAKLGNPRKAGHYTINVTIGTQKLRARVSIGG